MTIMRLLNIARAPGMFLMRRTFAEGAVPTHAPEELVLTLASPDEVIYNKHVVKQVDIPTKASTVGICAKHVPIIGRLVPGKVRITDLQGKIEEFEVSDGTISMNPDGTLQVLADQLIREGEESKKRPGSIQIQKWQGGKPTKNKIEP